MNNQVFVSYSSRSKNQVTFLKSFLESNSITSIWHDEDKLLAGVNVSEYIRRGILESDCCIFLLDEHSTNSAWCMVEVGAFWGANKPVIVYRANDTCEIPRVFAGIKVANSPDEIVRAVKAIPQRSPLAGAVITDSPHIKRLMRDIGDLSQTFAEIKREVTTKNEVEGALVRTMNQLGRVETLIGTKAIEKAATEIINASRKSDDIVATNQYSSGDLLSDDYMNAMADRVRRAKDSHGEMEVHVVMPVTTGSDSELEDRTSRVFRQKDIQDRLVKKHAIHPWPFEVLIVGNSMIIALRGGGEKPYYEVAIRIEDTEFVSKASKWFREVVWEEAAKDTQSDDAETPPSP